MDPQPGAPPVVAVVVTCDPGPWLEETLSALADQDYPNLSILVIDAASIDDPTPRVAAVLPGAYVRRLPERVGFSRAANEVLAIVEGASHYLFCHDDVAPEADTIRVLVEEAYRSNAGIVSPKIVDWDHPDRLLAVGQSVDKTGVVADLVEVGELDQEQHDAVRDVFCASSGCLLVRADLFATMGGFDPAIDLFGEALNISWRSQVAGARVVVAPGVRVRHVAAIGHRQREGWDDPGARQRGYALQEEHRIRTILTCYGVFHLIRVLPQALFLSLAQSAVQLVTGRPAMAGASIMAWFRALRNPGSLWSARRRVQRLRTVGDAEVRRLQTRGSADLRGFLRSTFGGEDPLDAFTARHSLATRLAGRAWRLPAAAWAVTVLVLLIGSRSLVGHAIPGVGSLPVFRGGPGSWWHLWWSGWRPDGLGSAAPAPPALALLSLAGTVLLGGVGLLQQVLVLGPLLIGPLGIYRASRPLDSPLARAAVLVTYAAVPVPYNALAGGRWAGLVAYAAAPWLLTSLCRLSGDHPFVAAPRRPARVVGLGLLLALAAAMAPALLVVVPLAGAGLAAGSALAGRPAPGLRALAASVGATVVAGVLLLPWTFDVVGSGSSLFGVAPPSAAAPTLGDLLRFHTGPVGNSLVAWGILAAATLPLLIGRSWRLAWACRLWGVALTAIVVAWAAGRGWLPIPLVTPELFLAPAAAALALCVGLGALAFQVDLPGYRLGWRQLASLAAAIGLALGSLPVLAAAGGGRWRIPTQDFGSTLATRGQAFRVLWIGDPRALPLGAWQLETGVGYATSADGPPDATSFWPPRGAGATPRLADAMRLASAGLTTQLGHLLAPMAVRYIVIPAQSAPQGAGGAPVAVPADILGALDQQTDLKAARGDDSLRVYENAAWAPSPALLATDQVGAAVGATTAAATQAANLAGASPALTSGGGDAFTGPLAAGSQVFVSATGQAGWKLSVGGTPATRRPAFGWAMLFSTTQGGKGNLSFATPVAARALKVLEMALWLAAGALLIADFRRRRGAAPRPVAGGPSVEPEVEPELVGAAVAGSHRRPRRVTVPDTGDDDEWWT
ncbi:MAG TPA: glycosyltransferase [Acidimicrobiales bacterium]|nr:glycosyltransferase [Acidimicrobiales bacterium]